MDRFDPFVKYADVYGDIINWEKDPMNKPQNQNKYFFSDGKTYYEQICKMLRLMSVFKEAFNQIYSNEDEISEAWENFVNNLSASVVEGSEPDVTLTWTDDSVNFEFTMVPGVPGEQGVGITSISFNSDYTMTITLSDGNTYTSMSLKGETGPQGPQGETGSGLKILDVYASLADLQSAHPTGQPGDAYQVGSAGNYILYIWSSSQSAWVQAGTLGTVSPYTSAPLMDGTASAGSQNLYARGDHVHPSDTSRASKEELDALIKTSQALIDQSFTYRESPAIQDGLARIDKIKGNTLVWNQLINNGNFENIGDWRIPNGNGSISNNVLTVNATGPDLQIYMGANYALTQGHKYFISCWIESSVAKNDVRVRLSQNNPLAYTQYISKNLNANERMNISGIITAESDTANTRFSIFIPDSTAGDIYKVDSFVAFDLTKMGLDSLNADEFTSLFPFPYYDYNAGSLLSFNGNGLKTVGFNQWDEQTQKGYWRGLDGNFVSNQSQLCSLNYIPVLPNTNYCYRKTLNVGDVIFYDANKVFISALINMVTNAVFTTPSNCYYIQINLGSTYGNIYNNDICINISDTSKNGTYEPYTKFVINLPISTYFPSGMKQAGTVYDELTPSKAITRVGSRAYQSGDESDTSVITDGTTTYYALATPTETAVDLDLAFNAYEDGTEQLLPVNASVPSTSPIIADMTYLSIDDAMEYIIDKLANVPQNTQQILDALEDDVDDLQTDVGALQTSVSGLQTSVGNINTNIGQLSSTVAGHTASISDMQSDITDLNTGLSNLEDTVTDNTSRISTLETGLTTTNGNVQSLSSQVQSIDGRVTNLESDLFKVVVKEFDYDSVASESNFGTTTPITQEEGYRVIGVVGTEAQAGEYTSPASNIAITQCHVYYTSLGALTITIFGRNNGASSRTNVRIYAYLLCIKDIQ